MQDVPLGEVVHFFAKTRSPTTGGQSDADSAPSWAIYEEDSDTAIQSGTFTKRALLTGHYRGSTTATSTPYDAGRYYEVVATAIVGGVTDSATVAYFRCSAAENTAGVPTSDVTRWAGTATTVSATTAKPEVDAYSVSDDATAANNLETACDGGSYNIGGGGAVAASVTGNVGGNVTGSVGSLAAQAKLDVNAEADTALSDIGLDHLVAASVTGTDITDDSIIANLVSISATADWDDYDNTTDSLQAIRDRGDAEWTTGAGGPDRLLLVDTTIATLSTQTSFTLTAGSADDDAYNGRTIVIEDAITATQKAVGIVDDYTGSTKTVTLLEDPGIFTMAVTDKVYILAETSLKPTTSQDYHVDVSAGGAVGIDWANVESPTTAVDLSSTDIQLCDTVTTNTDMRGTDSALLAASAPANFGDLAITATTGYVTAGTVNDKTGYSISGTITTLDALDTAQDSQHSTTQSSIAALSDLSTGDIDARLTAYFETATPIHGLSWEDGLKRIGLASASTTLSGAGSGTEVKTSWDSVNTATYTVDASGNISAVVFA